MSEEEKDEEKVKMFYGDAACMFDVIWTAFLRQCFCGRK